MHSYSKEIDLSKQEKQVSIKQVKQQLGMLF